MFKIFKRYMGNNFSTQNYVLNADTLVKVSVSREFSLSDEEYFKNHYAHFGHALSQVRLKPTTVDSTTGVSTTGDGLNITSLTLCSRDVRINQSEAVLEYLPKDRAIVERLNQDVHFALRTIVTKEPQIQDMVTSEEASTIISTELFNSLRDNKFFVANKSEFYRWFCRTHSPFLRSLLILCMGVEVGGTTGCEVLITYASEFALLGAFGVQTYFQIYRNVHQAGQMIWLLKDLLQHIENSRSIPWHVVAKKHVYYHRLTYSTATLTLALGLLNLTGFIHFGTEYPKLIEKPKDWSLDEHAKALAEGTGKAFAKGVTRHLWELFFGQTTKAISEVAQEAAQEAAQDMAQDMAKELAKK